MRTARLLLLVVFLINFSSIEAQQRQLYFLSHYSLNPTFNVKVVNQHALLASIPGVTAIDCSDLYNPQFSSSQALSSFPTSLLADQNYVYASGGMAGGFNVVNIAALPSLSFTGGISAPSGTSYQMVKSQDHIFFPTNQDSLYSVNISNPASPVIASAQAIPDFGSGAAVKGNFLYVGTTAGLLIYDISNPGQPVSLSSIPGIFRGLVYEPGNDELYACTDVGIIVYNVSVPATPQQVRVFNSPDFSAIIDPLAHASGVLFRVTNSVLEAYELALPGNTPASNYTFTSQINAVAAVDSIVYVSGVNGLTILKYGFVDPNGIAGYDAGSVANVYPNPFADKLNLALNNAGMMNSCSYQIYDTSGRLLTHGDFKSGQVQQLDLFDLAAGLYILRLNNSSHSDLSSVIKISKL